jgi:hypothetical protein
VLINPIIRNRTRHSRRAYPHTLDNVLRMSTDRIQEEREQLRMFKLEVLVRDFSSVCNFSVISGCI